MDTHRKPAIMDRSAPVLLPRLRAWIACAVLATMAACTTILVPSYDGDAIARTTDSYREILSLYGALSALPQAQRPDAANGALSARYADIEDGLQVHLLREQARSKNDESIEIAGNLLEKWRVFSASHRSGDPEELSDAKLGIERTLIEREFRSAFKAEEAKKLAETGKGEPGDD